MNGAPRFGGEACVLPRAVRRAVNATRLTAVRLLAVALAALMLPLSPVAVTPCLASRARPEYAESGHPKLGADLAAALFYVPIPSDAQIGRCLRISARGQYVA